MWNVLKTWIDRDREMERKRGGENPWAEKWVVMDR